MAIIDLSAGAYSVMDGTKVGPVLPAKDPIGWTWMLDGKGGDTGKFDVGEVSSFSWTTYGYYVDDILLTGYTRNASGSRIHAGMHVAGAYLVADYTYLNDGYRNSFFSPAPLSTAGTADNNATTWDGGVGTIRQRGAGAIYPDYRAGAFEEGGNLFVVWNEEVAGNNGVLHIDSFSERNMVGIFGTGATNTWVAAVHPATAPNSTLKLYKVNFTTNTVVYDGSINISIALNTSFYLRNPMLTVRVPGTNIWHLYILGTSAVMVVKVDADTGVYAEHTSSPLPLVVDAVVKGYKTPINQYFSADGGTTNYIVISDIAGSGLTTKIWYTINADSLSYSTENTNFLNELTAGNFDEYGVGPTNTYLGVSLERKLGTTYIVAYGLTNAANSQVWRYWFNFADAFRPTLDWSGWVEIDDPLNEAFAYYAGGQYPKLDRITSTYGDSDSDSALDSVVGLAGSMTPWTNYKYYESARIYHWDSRDTSIYMVANGQIVMQPVFGIEMNEIVSLAGTATIQILGGADLVISAQGNLTGFVRTLDQDWSRGQFREESHEEYIVGSTYYTHNLNLVNAARLAEIPPLTPFKSLFAAGAPPISDDYAYLILRQIIKHDTVYWHFDPSFDFGFQTYQQKADTMLADTIYGHSENLDQGLYYADPDTVLFPTIEDISQKHFDAWWASPGHKANMLYDWGVARQDYIYYLGSIDWSWPMDIASGFAANWAAQQFLDFSVPLGGNEMDRTWTNEYQLTGAEITAFYAQYSIAAWQDVRLQIGLPYALYVSNNFSFPYQTRVALQIRFPIHYSVLTAITLPYTSLVPVLGQITFPYALKPPYAISSIGYVYSVKVTTQTIFIYRDADSVVTQKSFPYSLRSHPIMQTIFPYVSISPVVSDMRFVYSIDLRDRALTDFIYRYSLLDETVITSIDDVNVMVSGQKIKVSSVSVEMREGSFIWSSTVILENLGAYNQFIQDSPFTVNIGTDSYEMVVEERSIDRSKPSKETLKITGLSPAIKHKVPRAASINFEMTSAMMAKDVVETILGELVTWNIQNWLIPAYRVSAKDISPIKLVSQIVKTVGAIPETLKDGTLQIRYTWGIDTNQYTAATPDQIYTDVADNLSAFEQTQPFALWNKFRIREGSGVFSDKIEYYDNDDIDGDSLRGILRVYPDPWRLTIRVIQTNGPSITLAIRGVVQREEVQLVEFVEGVGNVSYPIVSIDSIDWRSTSLGALVHEGHGTEITTPLTVNSGYGLAEITYTTEAVEYDTSAPPTTDAQFLVEDLG